MSMSRLFDHIGFEGESFHRREKAPGDGGTLLMRLWYLDVLIFLKTPAASPPLPGREAL